MSKKDFSESFGELLKGIDDATNNQCSSLDHISKVATDNSLATNQDIIKITAEINMYKNQAAESFIQIGRRLTQAKEMLSHGEFSHWLKNSVEFSERTARNFMRVADEFSNRNTCADLNYSQMLKLLQVPADERDEFISQDYEINGQVKSIKEMSARELEKVVKESKKEKMQEAQQPSLNDVDNSNQAFDIFKSNLDNACCNLLMMINGTSQKNCSKALEKCINHLYETSDKLNDYTISNKFSDMK